MREGTRNVSIILFASLLLAFGFIERQVTEIDRLKLQHENDKKEKTRCDSINTVNQKVDALKDSIINLYNPTQNSDL
jgi:hypothetical protein